jgi:AcrR family transcriptional regulator
MDNGTSFKIQKIAIRLFREKGYPNVTIDEICQEAGITKTSFYYHFKAKDQILTRFYENTGAINPETLAQVAVADDPWEKLWAMLEPSIDWTVETGPVLLAQILIANLQNNQNTFFPPNAEEMEKLYVAIIKKQQAAGKFRNFSNPERIGKNIQNIVWGICTRWCVSGGDFDLKVAIKESIMSLVGV